MAQVVRLVLINGFNLGYKNTSLSGGMVNLNQCINKQNKKRPRAFFICLYYLFLINPSLLSNTLQISLKFINISNIRHVSDYKEAMGKTQMSLILYISCKVLIGLNVNTTK